MIKPNGISNNFPTELEILLQNHEQLLLDLIGEIGEPTFKYMKKRIDKVILNNTEHQKMDVNEFFFVVVEALAMIDINFIRWMEGFYKIKTNEQYPEKKLQVALVTSISQQLKLLGN